MRWPWQSPPRKDPPRPRIRGVWGTVHSSGGDFDTETATNVEINGERMTFCLPVERCPFSCRFDSVTLHMGALVVELPIEPPMSVGRGDHLTVVQPVEMATLVARNPIRRDYR